MSNTYFKLNIMDNIIQKTRKETLWVSVPGLLYNNILAGIYQFKVNNRKTRAMSEICLTLTIKTPERRHWRRSGVFVFNFEQISHIALVFSLLLCTSKYRLGQIFTIKTTLTLSQSVLPNSPSPKHYEFLKWQWLILSFNI